MNKKHIYDSSFSNHRDYSIAWINSLFVDHAIFRLFWSNFQTVIPEKVYRCNHPTPSRLTALTKKYHLKTVINLRGKRNCGSDALSRHACQKLQLKQYDLPFESRGAPHIDRILNFAKIYKTLEFPLLIHCKSGADRAGLVSTLILLFENYDIHQAIKQLSWKYGHFKYSKTGILDAFFLQYIQQTNGKIKFLDWLQSTYNEELLKASFKTKKISSFITDKILRRE